MPRTNDVVIRPGMVVSYSAESDLLSIADAREWQTCVGVALENIPADTTLEQRIDGNYYRDGRMVIARNTASMKVQRQGRGNADQS